MEKEINYGADCEYCCACGKPIPEGHQFCPNCLPYKKEDGGLFNEQIMTLIKSQRSVIDTPAHPLGHK